MAMEDPGWTVGKLVHGNVVVRMIIACEAGRTLKSIEGPR
jgi:hypothetical protein